MKKIRIYADTSVYGGCFDEEFAEDSQAFFHQVREGNFLLMTSLTLARELDEAQEKIQRVLAELPSKCVEFSRSGINCRCGTYCICNGR